MMQEEIDYRIRTRCIADTKDAEPPIRCHARWQS